MKTIFLFFGVLFCTLLNAQVEQSPLIQADEDSYEIFYFDNNFNTEIASDMVDILENFNSDKITYVYCDYQQERIYLKTTSLFNKIEVLDIFRDHGMESYMIENNMKIRLNGTATGVYTVNNSED